MLCDRNHENSIYVQHDAKIHSHILPIVLQEKVMIRPKVVVALYPFKAIEGGDLSLEKVSIDKRTSYKLMS